MYSGGYSTRKIPSFRFGLNTRQSAEEISDFELSDCENWTIENDSIVTAQGYALWDTDPSNHAGPYWGGFGFRSSTGLQRTIRQRQGLLEYSTDGGEVWTACTMPTTGSPASTLVLTETQPTFASLNDIILYSNGVDPVLSSTDGITWSTTSLPISKVVFNNGLNRIVFAGQTASPYRIDWSDINDPLTINPLSYQLIDPNSNGEIVGMGKTPEGTNLVFKRTGVYIVSNYVTDGIIDVNYIGNAECFGHHTIQTTERSVIWCGYGSVFELIGGTIRKINGKILSLERDDVLKSQLYTSAYYNGKYHLSIPDATVSLDYNSQEYIYHLNLPRADVEQPYVVTRNKRYFGCYFIEDFEYDYGRDITLFVGDSRPSTSGSPAVTNSLFAWVNDYRDTSYQSGLGGQAQEGYFVTKYFTETTPFLVKFYKKIFLNLDLRGDVQFVLSYRFTPYGAWTDINFTSSSTSELEFLEDYGFLEGYGFGLNEVLDIFYDLENMGKNARGVQFKVKTNQINDVTIFSMAYKMLTNNNFR